MIVAGTAEPGKVYRYDGGTTWTPISDELGDAINDFVDYEGELYAAVDHNWGDGGTVHRYLGGTSWEQIFDSRDYLGGGSALSLVVYKNELYVGIGMYTAVMYRYISDNNWEEVFRDSEFGGFRAAYSWEDSGYLQVGDYDYDIFGHYDGSTYSYDVDKGGSCIWDFHEYNNTLYASAWEGRIHKSTDGISWTLARDYPYYDSDVWEMETCNGDFYFIQGSKWDPEEDAYQTGLYKFHDPGVEEIVSIEPHAYDIDFRTMIEVNGDLYIGYGGDYIYYYDNRGIGRVYKYDGTDLTLISDGNLSDVQVLHSTVGSIGCPRAIPTGLDVYAGQFFVTAQLLSSGVPITSSFPSAFLYPSGLKMCNWNVHTGTLAGGTYRPFAVGGLSAFLYGDYGPDNFLAKIYSGPQWTTENLLISGELPANVSKITGYQATTLLSGYHLTTLSSGVSHGGLYNFNYSTNNLSKLADTPFQTAELCTIEDDVTYDYVGASGIDTSPIRRWSSAHSWEDVSAGLPDVGITDIEGAF